MELSEFNKLTAKKRALIAVAVLLDGHEAGNYLENDAYEGNKFSKVAAELAKLKPEIRMPYLGTKLREAIEELGKSI